MQKKIMSMLSRHKCIPLVLAVAGMMLASSSAIGAGRLRTAKEGPLSAFMEREPLIEIQQIFSGQRFPNVVVTLEGTVLATWGGHPVEHMTHYVARRSEDAGKTWQPEQTIAKPGFHGGGLTVDEQSGNILAFVDAKHPTLVPQKTKAGMKVYQSADDGKTWQEIDVVVRPDKNGWVPAMHMCEHGITLRHGSKAGRLLRPARVYTANIGAGREAYNTAIYSDDGGKTWHPSEPFPAEGTGEGTVAELSDGTIYYNSRRHWAPQGVNSRRRWTAWSRDGGETWEDLAICEVLPDGAQHRDYGLMAGLVRLPVKGEDILLFSNIISQGGRKNGHIWVSFDGGETWPLKKLVDKNGFAYSSLASGRPGTSSEGWIYLFYEADGHPNSNGNIVRFTLPWLLDGEPTGDGEIPAEFSSN